MRADEVNHRHSQPAKLLCQPEMNLGEVDEHCHIWPSRANGSLELAELTINTRQMEDHLSESHDGHVFGADDAVDAGRLHARAAHTEQFHCFTFWSKAARQRRGEQRTVVLAARFPR